MKLKFWRKDLQLTHTWTIARGSEKTSQVLLLELSDGGATGLGEAAPIARYQESVDTVEAFCRRVDPARLSFAAVPASMKYLDTVAAGNMAAKCAFNIALLDGAARQGGKPLYGFSDLVSATTITLLPSVSALINPKSSARKFWPPKNIRS